MVVEIIRQSHFHLDTPYTNGIMPKGLLLLVLNCSLVDVQDGDPLLVPAGAQQDVGREAHLHRVNEGEREHGHVCVDPERQVAAVAGLSEI